MYFLLNTGKLNEKNGELLSKSLVKEKMLKGVKNFILITPIDERTLKIVDGFKKGFLENGDLFSFSIYTYTRIEKSRDVMRIIKDSKEMLGEMYAKQAFFMFIQKHIAETFNPFLKCEIGLYSDDLIGWKRIVLPGVVGKQSLAVGKPF